MLLEVSSGVHDVKHDDFTIPRISQVGSWLLVHRLLDMVGSADLKKSELVSARSQTASPPWRVLGHLPTTGNVQPRMIFE